jgi:hypothetical protein
MDISHVTKIFKNQEILEIAPNMGVSFGFVVKKCSDLVDLTDVHLIPVDGQVPKELLPPSDAVA